MVGDPSEEEDQGIPTGAEPSGPLLGKLPKRRFLQLVAGALSAGAAGRLLGDPPAADAAYIRGKPADTVDTDLTVQGTLKVNLKMGVGTSAPQGQLDVRGEVRNGALQLLGADGRGRSCYYAAGPVVPAPPSTNTGTWGRVRTTTWNALTSMTWNQAQSMNGSWDRVDAYSWSQIAGYHWDQVTTL